MAIWLHMPCFVSPEEKMPRKNVRVALLSMRQLQKEPQCAPWALASLFELYHLLVSDERLTP